jgi:type II secretory pathway component PulF
MTPIEQPTGYTGDQPPPSALRSSPGEQALPTESQQVGAEAIARRELRDPAVQSRELSRAESALEVSARETAEAARRRQARTDRRQFAEDAFLGYPAQTAQLADVLEDFSRLCMAGWSPPEALRHAGRGARPGVRELIEEAAVRAANGVPLSEALASSTECRVPSGWPLVAPALRAWERNGQRDADLRTLTREMRRLGDLQASTTFLQIRSLMERAASRERKAVAAATTGTAERRINASRGGIARRSHATMRWTDLFVSLWRCNVPISEALEVAGDGCGNNYYRHVLHRAAERTREGVPLSECLAETRLLPIGLTERLRTGELSGRFDETLEEFARVMQGDAAELGGQSRFMRRILPRILVLSAVLVFTYCSFFGNPKIALVGTLIFLPVAFALWEMVFKQSVAGGPNLGIGDRESKRPAEREKR